MAIYHLSTKNVSRSSGRSAVAAAAYRAGVRLVDDMTGKIHDYRRRRGVVHSEIILPAGSNAEWALDRSQLWNTAEKSEKRKDAKTASEIVIGLPKELNADLQRKLTMKLAQHVADKYGVAVDVAIHAPTSSLKNGAEDGEYHPPNYHAHLLFTTRGVEEHGLSKQKTIFEKDRSWLRKNNLPTGPEQVKELRKVWELFANEELALDGHDVRIDCRSHADRGLNIEPTKHVGVHATAMARRGENMYRQRLSEEDKIYNAKLIRDQPYEILKLITDEKSVFDRRDIARAVHRYVDDKDFEDVFATVMSMQEIIQLQPDTLDKNGRRVPAKLTTQSMIQLENQIIRSCQAMSQQTHKVSSWKVRQAITAESKALKLKIGGELSEEQRIAVRHLTSPEKISAVVGWAGAGKSTMLSAAKTAWEAQGYKVRGGAMAGKAAEGLQNASGIKSQTLASLERSWNRGYNLLEKDEVLVIDEAGLLDSHQLARIIKEVENRDAKLVLVGDPGQLQPIGAGSGFRAVVEQIGAAELTEIRRQKTKWQRQASIDFASGEAELALRAYDKHKRIEYRDTRTDTILSIAADYVADMDNTPNETRLALAHRKRDVQALNSAIRKGMQLAGNMDGEIEYVHQTSTGQKAFARGDRVVLEANDRELNVKNGMLGTITAVDEKSMQIQLDDTNGREVLIPMEDYQAVNYGYAITIHKSQGSTVDSTFVMASQTMDRHLGYVAMTRHSKSAKLYCNRQDFENLNELSKKLSKNRTNENPLDYLSAYSDRRDIGSGVADDIGPVRDRAPSDPLSKRNQAIDYFGYALEEMIWEELMNPKTCLDHRNGVWSDNILDAFTMLDRAEFGLSNVIIDTMDSFGENFVERIMDRSGSERVTHINMSISIQKMRQEKEQLEQDMQHEQEAKLQADHKNTWKPDEPQYTYRPKF